MIKREAFAPSFRVSTSPRNNVDLSIPNTFEESLGLVEKLFHEHEATLQKSSEVTESLQLKKVRKRKPGPKSISGANLEPANNNEVLPKRKKSSYILSKNKGLAASEETANKEEDPILWIDNFQKYMNIPNGVAHIYSNSKSWTKRKHQIL